MAIRQYIGARYVPKFVGTYDPTTAYEALEVVDNGSGTSYIARDNVPAGTPLTDTDHWFVYGASSGAIIALQNDMIQAQNDILTLQGEVEGSQTLKNRHVIALSDSYGMSVLPGWTDLFAGYAGIPSANYYSDSTSGRSFAAASNTFMDAIVTAHGAISDPDKITDIIVAAGYNDGQVIQSGGTIDDIVNAISAFVSYCSSNFKNAHVYIGFLGWTDRAGGISISYLLSACKAYKRCSEVGATYLSGVERILYDYDNLNGYHPNANGMDALAKYIAQSWLGGNVELTYSAKAITSFSTPAGWGTMTTTNVDMYELLEGDNLRLFSAGAAQSIRMVGAMSNMARGNAWPIFTNNAPVAKVSYMQGTCLIGLVHGGGTTFTTCGWEYKNGTFNLIPDDNYTSPNTLNVFAINAVQNLAY